MFLPVEGDQADEAGAAHGIENENGVDVPESGICKVTAEDRAQVLERLYGWPARGDGERKENGNAENGKDDEKEEV